MNKLLLIICLYLFALRAHAGDTTSVVIHFDFNKYQLSNEAKLQLGDIVPADTNTVLLNIKIYGHTDQVGSDIYNKNLSVKRAREAKAFLIAKGINPATITVVEGKGNNELITNEENETARQQNRRVLVIIEYEAKIVEETVIIQSTAKRDTTVAPKPIYESGLIDLVRDSATKIGNNVALKNIQFLGNQHKILQGSAGALYELLNLMRALPNLIIEIQGHICCLPNNKDGYDMLTGTEDLSVQRAKAVYIYLLQNGISEDRMTYKGFGRRQPLTKERTEEEKALNRRVEIKILKK